MTGEWTVLVADDEPLARRGVRQLLSAHRAFRVIGESRNGVETLAAIDSWRPDVVFLDIQMPGIDGFEVIRRRAPDRMPVLVLLTAWDQFALKAFDARAFDYLVKPVSETRFAETAVRLDAHLQAKAALARADLGAIPIATSQGVTLVKVAEIDWIEAADNYVRIWSGDRCHLLRESLNEIEARLEERGFVRAHRGALVRVGAVRELKRSSEGAGSLVLATSAIVPVSRRRMASVSLALRGAEP
jgi:two-component system, LytTR family, response regulator